jgi:hypothetical protein
MLWSILLSGQTDVVVFSTTGEAFFVGLDSKFQHTKAARNVKIKDIPEGDFWIQIVFEDAAVKGFKQSVRLEAGKEHSFMIESTAGKYSLKAYSKVARNQTNTVKSTQELVNYTNKGLEISISKAQVAAANKIEDGPNRVKGTLAEAEADGKKINKRQGQFRVPAEGSNEASVATEKPVAPKLGTTTESKFVRRENADGTTKIVEERITITRTMVTRNGQQFVKKSKQTLEYPTSYTCMPMDKDAYKGLIAKIKGASNALETAKTGIKGQCLTPGQLENIGKAIPASDLNNFAKVAQPTCADPAKFPFKIKEEPVVAVVEKPVVAPKVEEKKPMTAAELKAAAKAAKKAEKAAKKKAKAEAKAAKKAAKAAAKKAKAAEKARKKVAKAAAKAK